MIKFINNPMDLKALKGALQIPKLKLKFKYITTKNINTYMNGVFQSYHVRIIMFTFELYFFQIYIQLLQ